MRVFCCYENVQKSDNAKSGGNERSPRTYFSADEVRRAVARLDSELQALIALRYELDMSYRQIAQTMDISPTRVKWRLGEALKKLRAQMCETDSRPIEKGGDTP